jgi:hypothetical protein
MLAHLDLPDYRLFSLSGELADEVCRDSLVTSDYWCANTYQSVIHLTGQQCCHYSPVGTLTSCVALDIVVQCTSSPDHNLPTDSRLFLEVFFDQEKITKLGPLVRASESSWKAGGNVEL